MINSTNALTDNKSELDVVVSNEMVSVTSAAAILQSTLHAEKHPLEPGEPPIKILVEQIQVGTYRSDRILLDGKSITTNGSTVQLTLRGRSSGNYTVQRVSLIRRDRNTLNGVDSTHRQITFGGTWNAGVTVPAGGTVTSAPIPFDLLAGQDVFVTYWVPSGNPTLYRTGGATTSAWTITGTDQTAAIDWGSLSTTETLTYIYIAESLEVLAQSGGGPPTDTTPPPPSSLTISNLTVRWAIVCRPASGLQVGNTVYIDRSYTFTTGPSSVQGAAYIQTANQETRTLFSPPRSFPQAAGGNPSVGWGKVGQHGKIIETQNALVPPSVIPASRWRESIRCLDSGFRSKRWIPATNCGYDDQVRIGPSLILIVTLTER